MIHMEDTDSLLWFHADLHVLSLILASYQRKNLVLTRSITRSLYNLTVAWNLQHVTLG